MIPRIVKRRIRPMWLAAVASAAWVNRKDVMRWADFLRRAARQRQTRPLADWITEAKVRAAVTSDPVLRRDPALEDLAVNDGVVTLVGHLERKSLVPMVIHLTRTVPGVVDVVDRLSYELDDDRLPFPPTHSVLP